MHANLNADELVALIKRVFSPSSDDRRLAIIVDMPDDRAPDTEAWAARRQMAADWAFLLAPRAAELDLDDVSLVLYRNPAANNADLPADGYLYKSGPIPTSANELAGDKITLAELFDRCQIVIAPTQFSATAPLKMAAPKHNFRAATMPGFAASMIPALRLDYGVIGARVDFFKDLVDRALRCDFVFDAAGVTHKLTLDLRHRQGHASGGVFPTNGAAGNLPSGEAYIVPYEGEIDGDPSATKGEIPVQFGDDIVVYRVEDNRAYEVISDNEASKIEARKLLDEPAYGNLAELGLGVLGDFGLEPSGEILLDEKLGIHIAFGRSEHFGGQVSPAHFSGPDKVVHIDRVYIPALQPDVTVKSATLLFDDGEMPIMKNGEYSVHFPK